MVNLGTRFKTVSTGEITLIMRYLEMRWEIKNLLKAERSVIKGNKHLEGFMKKHKIEDANVTLKKENEDIKTGFNNAYKLMSNDMICLKVLAKIINELKEEMITEEKMLKHAEREKRMISAKDYEKIVNELVKERQSATTTARYSQYLLRKARIIINGLYNLCKGKMDSAFYVRDKFFLDWYIVNYFKMRWEARGVRRDIKTEEKLLNDFKKHEDNIKKAITGKIKIKAGEVAKYVKDNAKKEIKDVEGFNKALNDAFKDVLKIFVNSALLFEKILIVLREENVELDKWGIDHELPLAMVNLDKEEKHKLLTFAEQVLSAMNTDIIQLSNVFN